MVLEDYKGVFVESDEEEVVIRSQKGGEFVGSLFNIPAELDPDEDDLSVFDTWCFLIKVPSDIREEGEELIMRGYDVCMEKAKIKMLIKLQAEGFNVKYFF